MKHLFALILALIAVSVMAQNTRRYEFRSMVVTYKLESSGMGTTSSGTKTLKIDDYGAKEAREEKSSSTTSLFGKTTKEDKHTLDLLAGDYGYSIDLINREGTRMNVTEMANAFRPAGMAMAKDLEKYQGKDGMKLFVEDNGGTWHGDETFLGKSCQVFSLMGVKMWMYKGLMLKSESTAYGMEIRETAQSVQENVSIPASAFALPDGITITDLDKMEGLEGILGGLSENEDEQPAEGSPPGLAYDRFVKATTGLKIPGYKYFMSDNSTTLYLTSYVKTENDQVVIFMENESRFYEMAGGGEGMIVEENYTFDSHDAVYIRITHEDDGTPVDSRSLLIRMPEHEAVLYLITGAPFPKSELENIIRQIRL
jgi:hypothetical protein